MSTIFEWDPAKAASNLRKHGISFETALRAFADPLSFSQPDRTVGGEQRWQTLGRVNEHLIALVAYTVEEEDDDGDTTEIIRIISAREADPKEKRRYAEHSAC